MGKKLTHSFDVPKRTLTLAVDLETGDFTVHDGNSVEHGELAGADELVDFHDQEGPNTDTIVETICDKLQDRATDEQDTAFSNAANELAYEIDLAHKEKWAAGEE